eukprot:GHVU01017962.1.p1 GENE.GHVU01017962.1~~GHVU01017962.1.p1  ORF type:complete len:212 (+),score=31.80 GHVU01017962.1:222-857(+)
MKKEEERGRKEREEPVRRETEKDEEREKGDEEGGLISRVAAVADEINSKEATGSIVSGGLDSDWLPLPMTGHTDPPSSSKVDRNSERKGDSKAPLLKIPQKLRRLVGKALFKFEMIREGDRVLVEVSGGKDSLTLLHVLRVSKGVSEWEGSELVSYGVRGEVDVKEIVITSAPLRLMAVVTVAPGVVASNSNRGSENTGRTCEALTSRCNK